MASDSRVKAATDLAFQRLAMEITSLAPDSEILDGSSYLLTFAELVTSGVEPGGEYVRLHLSAGVPDDPFQGMNAKGAPPSRDHLIKLIEEPRKAAEAGVSHFFKLAGDNNPYQTTVFDLLRNDTLLPLRDIIVNPVKNVAPIIMARMNAFLSAKALAWDEVGPGVLAAGATGVLGDKIRNALDNFIFLRPDIIAISLPILGSPIVHCYLGVEEDAYRLKQEKLVSLLYGNMFRRLREVVWPFVLARISAAAGKYFSNEIALTTPAGHTALFLREVAGLLLAKTLVIPPFDDVGTVMGYTAPADLRIFDDGERLVVDLPKEGWPGEPSKQAVFQLPRFNVLQEHESTIVPRSSIELDGTSVQLATVRNLLEQLAEFVFSTSVARQTIADRQIELESSLRMIAHREAVLDTALKSVRRIVSELAQLEVTLQVTARALTRVFLERLPTVMKREPGSDKLLNAGLTSEAEQTIVELITDLKVSWNQRLQEDYPGSLDLKHFLRDLDQMKRSVATDQLRTSFSKAVVGCARAIHGATVPDQQVENVTAIVRLLCQTRFQDDDGRLLESLLGWALDNDLMSYQIKSNEQHDYWKVLATKCLSNSGPIDIESLTIDDGVPPLAVTLFLAVVGSWYDGQRQGVSIHGSVSDDRIHFIARVSNPHPSKLRDDRKPYTLMADLIEKARATPDEIERFKTCVLLLDSVYAVHKDSPTPSLAGDSFELFLVVKDADHSYL